MLLLTWQAWARRAGQAGSGTCSPSLAVAHSRVHSCQAVKVLIGAAAAAVAVAS